MVRIVKIEPHPAVVKEVVCKSCGVTLEYVPHDITIRKCMDYLGDYEEESVITCPNCSKEVHV